jgi:predicted nucleotidyltransferase
MEFGRPNRELIGKIEKNANYRRFHVPMEKLDRIIDATFFLRHDGLLVFSEGYFHPPGRLIGNIIYYPSEAGRKEIFGQKYQSVIKKEEDGREEWIPFDRQLQEYYRLDPGLNRERPVFAEYKLLFDLDEFVAFFPTRRAMREVRRMSPEIDRAIADLCRLLGMTAERIGCTGSLAFGNVEDPHDLDLVFFGTLEENARVIERIYTIVQEPGREVIEFGHRWAIRYYDDKGYMICPFFSYARTDEIPLAEFEINVLADDVRVRGSVADDTHSCYMPSILTLQEATVDGKERAADLRLIIYNGGLRGEHRSGDGLEVQGRLVRVTAPGERYEAVLVTNVDQIAKR